VNTFEEKEIRNQKNTSQPFGKGNEALVKLTHVNAGNSDRIVTASVNSTELWAEE
jgi:DNA repair protein RadA/Sms